MKLQTEIDDDTDMWTEFTCLISNAINVATFMLSTSNQMFTP